MREHSLGLGRSKNKERSSAERLGLGSLRNVPYTAGSRLVVSCRQLLESKCADWSAGYQWGVSCSRASLNITNKSVKFLNQTNLTKHWRWPYSAPQKTTVFVRLRLVCQGVIAALKMRYCCVNECSSNSSNNVSFFKLPSQGLSDEWKIVINKPSDWSLCVPKMTKLFKFYNWQD